ncbi:endonuclease/exonuclease/phosphatase family protein [Spirosoma koreense]
MALRIRIGELITFFFRSLLWSINLWLVFYTWLAYWLLYSLPTQHWLAGLIMITIPVAWVLNFVVLLLWLTARPWRSWLSGIVLIVGIALFGSRTFGWNQINEFSGNGTPLKVFSYNVKTFDLDLQTLDQYPSSPRFRRLANYVLHVDAPIKCFQEFYTSTISPDYDFFQRFRKAGYPYSCILHPVNVQSRGGAFGMAIFSIYPIINWGREPFEVPNGLLWADIKVGNDTIRVINVHLHSMGIRIGKVFQQDEIKEVKQETRGVLSALRTGFVERNIQVTKLQQYIQASPYPVIVTGDFNDTPYGVVYERMRRLLPNSFEEKGHGFGFSYNHMPNFIRIDHQFHDPQLSALNFETINYVTDSDHYPIMGTYVIK